MQFSELPVRIGAVKLYGLVLSIERSFPGRDDGENSTDDSLLASCGTLNRFEVCLLQ
jgi:hypothetical protein